MRIAIVHYHLKRGGVTRVIESTLNAFQSLATAPHCAVLAGEVPDDCSFKEHAYEVPGLEYSNAQEQTPEPEALLTILRETAMKALGGAPDVWHIHNHSLGKNSAMPGIVSLLAEAGDSILLHMHDFAEDGRPQNHLLNQEVERYAAKLYPTGSTIHYAVLNGRDHEIFSETALPGSQVHLLANPVDGGSTEVDPAGVERIYSELKAKRLFLYPVRAVRRKNFGEMLFWAALAETGDVFATTLGTTNQNYIDTYNEWQAFAQAHDLPVRFGVGEQYDWSFPAIMQSASCILSTSIAEGFGLAFLEPWLFGKVIAGRDIPDITADFKAAGIDLNHLYPTLPIPKAWVDLDVLKQSIARGLSAAYQAYNQELPEDAVTKALSGIEAGPGWVDFAGLDETLQRAVIEHVLQHPAARAELPIQRLDLAEPGQQAGTIRKRFSLEGYAQQLSDIYTSVCEAPKSSTSYIAPKTVLNGFLKPERFRLLRT
ncbi:MAG: hypothetical protein ACPGKS_02785 [Coraliomargarita sp.]